VFEQPSRNGDSVSRVTLVATGDRSGQGHGDQESALGTDSLEAHFVDFPNQKEGSRRTDTSDEEPSRAPDFSVGWPWSSVLSANRNSPVFASYW
jgi:hypothetical protein